MQPIHLRSAALLLMTIIAGYSLPPANGQGLVYPVTRKSDQVDDYHGTKVADPYRWLEDDNSPETLQWVKAENEVTFGYLEKIPYRAQVKHRLEELYNYAKYTPPFRKGNDYFFFKNDGLQNQNILYAQTGLAGKAEVLLDPNKFSEDGTSRPGHFRRFEERTISRLRHLFRRFGLAGNSRHGSRHAQGPLR